MLLNKLTQKYEENLYFTDDSIYDIILSSKQNDSIFRIDPFCVLLNFHLFDSAFFSEGAEYIGVANPPILHQQSKKDSSVAIFFGEFTSSLHEKYK